MNVADRFKKLLTTLDTYTGGIPGIVKVSFERFGKVRGSQAAASMSYYALFSLFPLLLVLVSIGSYLISGDPVQKVVDLVSEAIPASRPLIEGNLEQVLEARGTVGLIGLVTLIWSASGVFSVLVTNINLAWPEAEKRNFFVQRGLAIGMVAVLFLLLVLSVVSTTAANLLGQFEIPVFGEVKIYGSFVWTLISNGIPWVLSFLLFLGLYRWVPNTKVKFLPAFWGALLTATAWEVANTVFAWYLESSFNQYALVYGSLGAVIALLFVIYISSWIILYGAHLSASIQREMERKNSDPENPYR